MRRRNIIIAGTFLVLSIAIIIVGTGAQAAPDMDRVSLQVSTTPEPLLSISNEVCLSCHGQPGPVLELKNGDVLDLYVSPDEYNSSVHGESGYACVQCHRQIGNYPHPPFQAEDLRDASLQLYPACQGCHQHQYELAQDSVHTAALNSGIREAAVCTDCHSAHTVQRLNHPGTLDLLPETRAWVPRTCAKCHSAIFDQYAESVHGSALLDESNIDVPTCIDCHSVHNTQDPTTVSFRLRSPDICAKCHTDKQKMAKYGLSTDVLNTYVADFHGTTVMLFEKMTPDAETNKPVCYDCHGVHDIRRTDDPTKGLHVRENLLARCQLCHPNATTNFSAAWLSHYVPSPDKNPIVYYVNLFYKFFIPTVLGGMAILVVLDLNKLMRGKIRARVKQEPLEEETDVGVMDPDDSATDLEYSDPEKEILGDVDVSAEQAAASDRGSEPLIIPFEENAEEFQAPDSQDDTGPDEEETSG